jgi:hypothetical protein
MRAFLWAFEDGMTTRQHSGGSLLIIAESAIEAEQLWRENSGKDLSTATFMPRPGTKLLVPDGIPAPYKTWAVDPYSKSEVFVFPNHGCC